MKVAFSESGDFAVWALGGLMAWLKAASQRPQSDSEGKINFLDSGAALDLPSLCIRMHLMLR